MPKDTTDAVRDYLSRIGNIPLLQADEEIELSRKIQQQVQLEEKYGINISPKNLEELSASDKKIWEQGQRAKARMIESNLRLVVSIAKKYLRQQGAELLDLIQEGSIGLKRATEKFDPSRGYKFSTYATWWIRQSISRELSAKSRAIRLPNHVVTQIGIIRRSTSKFSAENNRMPTIDELSNLVNLKPDWIRYILLMDNPPVSLDLKVGFDADSEAFSNFIGFEDNAINDTLEQVEQWLSLLDKRAARILAAHYGLYTESQTLTTVANELNMSRDQARQLQSQGMRKLRRHLSSRGSL